MPRTVPSKIRVELSAEELQAIIKLAEDQIFRVKFIDPKMPGHTKNTEELHVAESGLAALKLSLPKQFARALSSSDVHVSKEKAPSLPSR